MSLEALLTPAVIFICFGLTIWILRADLASIRKRMDCFESSQHACQLQNAKEFATRGEHKALEDKVNDHGGRISKLEAQRG